MEIQSGSRIRRIGRLAAVASLLSGAAALAQPVEPLVIRVADAEGAPGETTAIVLRTYASRPVSQGRLRVGAGGGALRGPGAPLVVEPLAAFEGGFVYSAQGDTVESFVFDPVTQEVTADFSSVTAGINAADGVLAVLYFTLDPALQPGDQFTIAIDLGVSFLVDADGQPMSWTLRAGELTIRAPGQPLAVSADGPKVHPGSGADVGIETLEPFAVAAGRFELLYPTDVLSGPVTVSSDPRHGSLQANVTFPAAGRVRIDFFSPDQDFNEVPGELFVVHLPTRADVPLGTTRPLSLDPAQSWLVGPGSLPLSLAFEGDLLEFVSDPVIFHDAFESGSSGNWSARIP